MYSLFNKNHAHNSDSVSAISYFRNGRLYIESSSNLLRRVRNYFLYAVAVSLCSIILIVITPSKGHDIFDLVPYVFPPIYSFFSITIFTTYKNGLNFEFNKNENKIVRNSKYLCELAHPLVLNIHYFGLVPKRNRNIFLIRYMEKFQDNASVANWPVLSIVLPNSKLVTIVDTSWLRVIFRNRHNPESNEKAVSEIQVILDNVSNYTDVKLVDHTGLFHL